MNYIQSKPDVGSAELALSKTYTESFLSADKTYQRTDSIKLSSDSRNTITIPLQKGVTLVNETTGAVGTGNVTVKGGDTKRNLEIRKAVWQHGEIPECVNANKHVWNAELRTGKIWRNRSR